VDAGAYNPVIAATMFPATPGADFWSSSSYAGEVSTSWFMGFDDGVVNNASKSAMGFVRCVRGGPTPRSARFTRDTSVTSYPVVIDNATGLEWQGCHAGWIGDACTTDDLAVTGDTFTWQNALSQCETLSWGGHTDWRLPNRKELHSLVDNHDSSAPVIDTTAFPATPSSYFWSSSSYAYNVSYAWYVYFDNGNVSNSDKSYANYARCVRGGP
jgi:hypothetical protein